MSAQEVRTRRRISADERNRLRLLIDETRRARMVDDAEQRALERQLVKARRRPRWLRRAATGGHCAYCGETAAGGVCGRHADILDVDLAAA